MRASFRTLSKSHSGISDSTFLRAPAISTADTPTFTSTSSSFFVLKCSTALHTGRRLPLSIVTESVMRVYANGLENLA